MEIKDYLSSHILVTDGAMQTYFELLKGEKEELVEQANITEPNSIKEIHKSYIEKGAKLIRTNTFAVNHVFFHSQEEIKNCISKGYAIAQEAVQESGQEVYIGAAIGPIPEDGEIEDREPILEEYRFICDCFLEMGCRIFIFETFTVLEDVLNIAKYLKEKDDTIFVIGNFHFNKIVYKKE